MLDKMFRSNYSFKQFFLCQSTETFLKVELDVEKKIEPLILKNCLYDLNLKLNLENKKGLFTVPSGCKIAFE